MNPKRLSLFLALTFAILSTWADNVSLNVARQLAQDFLSKKGKALTVKANPFRAPRLDSNDDNSYYYAFNAEDGGFVIISGDDRTQPVLGYSTSGAFDIYNMPENMRNFLQGYEDEIRLLDEKGITSSTIKKAPSSTVTDVAKRPILPLITTKWGQGSPYNDACPKFYYSDGSTGQSVTGCVATAVAQVMYYHKWPMATTAEIPSVTNSYTQDAGGKKSVTVPAIVAGTPIDWDKMLPSYSGTSTTTQRNAVAQLMLMVGQSVNMSWGASSGSSNYTAARSLVNYFGYDSDITSIDRADYKYDKFCSIIYNELAEGRPVLLGGQSTGGGHSFVADGHDGDEYFHINWGWTGYSDGYFLMSSLNPDDDGMIGASSTSDGYARSQYAIIGIQAPDGKSSEIEPTTVMNSSYVSYSAYSKTISFSYFSNYKQTANFEFGLGAIDNNGKITPVDITSYNGLMPSTGFSNYSLSVSSLERGKTYHIIPIGRVIGVTDFMPNYANAESNYIEVKVASDGSMTMKSVSAMSNISVEGVSCESSGYVNEEQTVKISFNNAGGEFYQSMYFFASTTTSKGSSKSSSGVTFKGYGKSEAVFNFTPTATGKWNIWVSPNSSSSSAISCGSITISNNEASSDKALLKFQSYEVNNKDKVSGTTTYFFGDELSGEVMMKNVGTATYRNNMVVALFKTGESSSSTLYKSVLEIAPGETKGVPFYFKLNDTSTSYRVGIYSMENGSYVALTSTSYYYKSSGGIAYYAADGSKAFVTGSTINVPEDATCVIMEKQGVTSITPNSNPNTLYFLSSSDPVPSTIADKNIVIDNNADMLSLQDGHDFYTPKAFYASNASYTRTETIGADGDNGWSTFILPFTAYMVECEGKTIDWYRSETDTGKDFWLKQFKGNNNLDLVFGYTDEIEAGIPYIIALPGAAWGAERDLTNKPISFLGEEVSIPASTTAITSTSTYMLKGATFASNRGEVYQMNNEGNAFVPSSATVPAFRCFFEIREGSGIVADKLLVNSPLPTAINSLSISHDTATGDNESIYTISGQRLGNASSLNSLQKGVYIINGKKVIMK